MEDRNIKPIDGLINDFLADSLDFNNFSPSKSALITLLYTFKRIPDEKLPYFINKYFPPIFLGFVHCVEMKELFNAKELSAVINHIIEVLKRTKKIIDRTEKDSVLISVSKSFKENNFFHIWIDEASKVMKDFTPAGLVGIASACYVSHYMPSDQFIMDWKQAIVESAPAFKTKALSNLIVVLSHLKWLNKTDPIFQTISQQIEKKIDGFLSRKKMAPVIESFLIMDIDVPEVLLEKKLKLQERDRYYYENKIARSTVRKSSSPVTETQNTQIENSSSNSITADLIYFLNAINQPDYNDIQKLKIINNCDAIVCKRFVDFKNTLSAAQLMETIKGFSIVYTLLNQDYKSADTVEYASRTNNKMQKAFRENDFFNKWMSAARYKMPEFDAKDFADMVLCLYKQKIELSEKFMAAWKNEIEMRAVKNPTAFGVRELKIFKLCSKKMNIELPPTIVNRIKMQEVIDPEFGSR